MSDDTFRTVDDASRLPDNYVNPYYLQDRKLLVAVARIGGRLFAFDDLYEGAPLSSGLLTGSTLMSQYDGSQFDVTTGRVLRGPAEEPLSMHEVREQNGKIELRI
jgi:3-phenylpropionate/trans-cinnamate dioxygenase ferredoxin component